jgi:hypothetical protein
MWWEVRGEDRCLYIRREREREIECLCFLDGKRLTLLCSSCVRLNLVLQIVKSTIWLLTFWEYWGGIRAESICQARIEKLYIFLLDKDTKLSFLMFRLVNLILYKCFFHLTKRQGLVPFPQAPPTPTYSHWVPNALCPFPITTVNWTNPNSFHSSKSHRLSRA